MDDLLKVFLGETSECLTACWAAVERLRRMPGDSAALGDLLHQVRSVQETSKFLGMSALQASAGLVLESLESASARRPASTDRIVPIAVDGLLRIEAVINAMANAEGEPAPHAAATSRFASAAPAANPGPVGRHRRRRREYRCGLDGRVAAAPGAGSRRHRSHQRGDAGLPRFHGARAGRCAGRDDAAAAGQRGRAGGGRGGRGQPRASQRPAQPAKAASSPTAPKAAAQPTVQAAAPEPASVRPAQVLGAASPGMIRVLLFRGADGAPRAAYLDQVAGLEEVDLKAVDQSRGLWIMRSGSDLLPLVAIDPAGKMPSGGARARHRLHRRPPELRPAGRFDPRGGRRHAAESGVA